MKPNHGYYTRILPSNGCNVLAHTIEGRPSTDVFRIFFSRTAESCPNIACICPSFSFCIWYLPTMLGERPKTPKSLNKWQVAVAWLFRSSEASVSNS